jgi:hypothetical protein
MGGFEHCSVVFGILVCLKVLVAVAHIWELFFVEIDTHLGA